MAKSTTYKVYDASLDYAQVFERNMDKGNDDSDTGRTIASKGGQTKVTMVITEAVKDLMIADGIPEKSMGHDMFKGPDENGNYRYAAKRPWNSPFTDEETGEIKPFGEPNVVDYNATVEAGEQVPWDSEVNIGNGTEAKVKLSIYKNGSKRIVRLESVGVTKLVEYVSSGEVRF
jgi:hypothetical protein